MNIPHVFHSASGTQSTRFLIVTDQTRAEDRNDDRQVVETFARIKCDAANAVERRKGIP